MGRLWFWRLESKVEILIFQFILSIFIIMYLPHDQQYYALFPHELVLHINFCCRRRTYWKLKSLSWMDIIIPTGLVVFLNLVILELQSYPGYDFLFSYLNNKFLYKKEKSCQPDHLRCVFHCVSSPGFYLHDHLFRILIFYKLFDSES